MNKLITFILFSFITVAGFAQANLLSGNVSDASGQGMPGVTVLVKGTNNGSITDLDGNFQINVTSGNVLQFSYLGYESQEIIISNQTSLKIMMKEELTVLNEVVVIGYGVQKKKDLTTAVSVVDEKAIRDRPMISAAEALQGKAAGVQVSSPSGKPGNALAVRVRGATSVLAGNEPLYVIDGVPTTDIQGLNPSDIATLSVLKDASSASIYGARAANGVVLITTKRGKDIAPSISFNSYFGFSRLRKPIEVLNTKDYRNLMSEINYPLDASATGYTNWSDKVFGTGQSQAYQLSITGGNEKSKYFVSAGYLSDAGIIAPAKFDRYTVRVNLDNQIKPWLKMGTSLNILHLKTKDTPDNASSGRGGVIMSTLNTPPFLSVYKKDGSGWYDPNPFAPSWENPVAYMEGAKQQAVDDHLVGNIYLEGTIIKGLILITRLGTEVNFHQWEYYLDPFKTSYGRKQHGIGRADKTNYASWMWENTLTYTKSIGKHNLTAMAGSSIQKAETKNSYLEGNDFPENTDVTTLNAANVITGLTGFEHWAIASFFGRATYDFNSKYYLSATVREDGSSKLNHHWGTMPSFSAGWRMSSENFMKDLTFIDDLKIRGGWGKNGNQEGIPNYTRYGLIEYFRRTPTDPLSGPYAVWTTYGNPDLKWETTSQSNIGFDLFMFNYRLTINLDAYYKKTSDVLLPVIWPSTAPVIYMQTNAGTIENKGIEFNISSVNLDKKLRWTTDFNMSFNKNEVLYLKYTKVYYAGGTYSNNSNASIIKVGMPLGSFFGYISEGVDPETGDIKYKDLNNNGIFDTGDRTKIGDGQPKFTFGFTNSLSYGRFDLNIFLQGSYGNDIFNATRIDLEGMFDSKNQSVDVLRRWTSPGQITDIPRAVGGGNTDNVRNSSRFVEDGSYLRLKALTLSYKAIENNSRFKAIKKLSVYVTGQNLLTLTKYSGFDPEVSAYNNSAAEMGIDYGTYPQSITMIVGLNVEF
jgi:TonB-linked SusC/RagA family outer membrane protein